VPSIHCSHTPFIVSSIRKDAIRILGVSGIPNNGLARENGKFVAGERDMDCREWMFWVGGCSRAGWGVSLAALCGFFGDIAGRVKGRV